jgi:hypothetical protein
MANNSNTSLYTICISVEQFDELVNDFKFIKDNCQKCSSEAGTLIDRIVRKYEKRSIGFKNQFQQFYHLFGGYSVGGFTLNGVAYVRLGEVLNSPIADRDWRGIIEKANKEGWLIAATRIEVVPDEEYYRLRGEVR